MIVEGDTSPHRERSLAHQPISRGHRNVVRLLSNDNIPSGNMSATSLEQNLVDFSI